MKKFTWKSLRVLLEKQYKLTPDDAMQIILENLFGLDWKHGKGGKLGRMWKDPMIVSTFTQVLAEEDKIAKTTNRKKVQQELFKSDAFETFRVTAELKYPKYGNFKNDYTKWKRLPMFKPSWIKGTITVDKYRIKKEKLKAAEKILRANNKSQT